MRRLARVLAVVAGVLALAALGLRWGLGGGVRLADRTTPPRLPGSALETVAVLDHPPGNIAVSSTGRVFFTFHPDGDPPVAVAELIEGKPIPYPSTAAQRDFETPLSLRIDRQ